MRFGLGTWGRASPSSGERAGRTHKRGGLTLTSYPPSQAEAYSAAIGPYSSDSHHRSAHHTALALLAFFFLSSLAALFVIAWFYAASGGVAP
jgi:hypothetical protein